MENGDEAPAGSPKAQSGAQHQGKSTSQPGSKQVEQPAAPASKSQSSAPSSSGKASSAPSPSVPAPSGGGRGVRRVAMSRMRQTIAKRLKDAQNTAAMLTTFNEIDMSVLMDVRNKYKDDFFERTGVKLGFMSAFVKASTAALQKYPDVNAYIEGNELVYHDYVDVSVAVSTPTGLVVPVLRNTETMSFAQIEAAIGALGAKARKGQISLEDMTGGTFTISNGGVYGSLFGTPIIKPSAGRHPRHARHLQAAGVCGGQGGGAAYDVCGADVRPPHSGRQHGGAVSQRNQKQHRGPRQTAAQLGGGWGF